jgi:hypothetical protein
MNGLTRFIAAGVLLGASGVLAQDAAVPPPAEPSEPEGFVLRELVVLQTDRYDDLANNPKLIPTTLTKPIEHTGRSKRVTDDAGYDHSAMPLGVITLAGELAEPMKMRLTMNDDRDRFHALWPSVATVGDRLLQWDGIEAAAGEQLTVPLQQNDDWLGPLRASEDRLWFATPDKDIKDRLFLYDASFVYEPAIELSRSQDDDGYVLSTNRPERAAPPLTLLLQKTDAGWRSDAQASPWPGATVPVPKNAGGNESSEASLAEALQPLIELLQQRGYNAAEIDLAIAMVGGAGIDASAMSLVYVMPVGVLDEYVRLQIRPQPSELIRTAIVVVNSVDPDLGSRVDQLVADLGSDDWDTRDRAQQRLLDLGQAAIEKITPLKNSSDPEVAFRVRQIIGAYEWQMETGP